MKTAIKNNRHKTSLRAGQKAPEFEGVDQDGNVIRLSELRGKKIALFFYPQDDTPGCTTQSCNLRDNYEELQARGYYVIGVSADDVKSHSRFARKYKIPFPLLADEKKEIIRAYDVWGKKVFLGIPYMGIVRTTFIIGETGIIEGIIDNVDTSNHSSQIITLSEEKTGK